MIEEINENTNEKIARIEETIKLAKKLCMFIFAFIILFVLIFYLIFSLNLFYVLIFIPLSGIVFISLIKGMRAEIEITENFSCSECHYVNQKDAIYCQQCGSKLN